ncbi:MAG TPA: glycosyltransferase family 39 protein [bacterium]
MPRVPRPLLAGLVCLTAIRLGIAATLPIGDDEAFYWEWSRHLAAGYVDHPPAIAYLVWAAVHILGRTPLAVHAVAILLSFGTSLGLYALAREITGREDAALWSVVLWNLIPVFDAAALVTAPDAPLFFFWVLTLLAAWRAAHGGTLWTWLASGVWLGLALLSKYMAAALPVSIGLWLALSPERRRWLIRPEPYAAGAVALALFAPVVWWNAMHHWISFVFTALGTSGWTNSGDFRYFLSTQFLYLGPVIFPTLVGALAIAWRRGRARAAGTVPAGAGGEGWRFLAATGWPVILGTGAASLLVQAKPHWSAPGYIAAVIALAAIATERPRHAWSRIGAWGAGLAAGLTTALAIVFHALPWLASWLLPPQIDPAMNYYGWAEAGPAIVMVAEREARGPFFVTSDWYQVMAPFDFSIGGRVPSTTITGDDQYRFWTQLDTLRGRDGLFIRDNRQTYDIDLEQVCESLDVGPRVPLMRRGVVIRTLDLIWCRRFSGRPAPRLAPYRWHPGVGGPARRLSPA